jgi:exopolysaccharide production protein ExoY
MRGNPLRSTPIDSAVLETPPDMLGEPAETGGAAPPGLGMFPASASMPSGLILSEDPTVIVRRSVALRGVRGGPIASTLAGPRPKGLGAGASAGVIPGASGSSDVILLRVPTGDDLMRALDMMVALVALFVALPLMAAVALSVRLTSPGPVLFAHRRVGLGGRRFACLKFRTMVTDADAQLKALLARDPAARAEWQRSQKLRRDPRVTIVGRFLRRTSLDELPQLFNVLMGEMSLVGPRPIVESEIPRYGRHFTLYCQVRPGVTGLWQVQREADTSYRRRVAFDVAYARSRSPRLYLLILARTVPVVLTGKGAW